MKLLSIAIPCYNSAAYMENCIRSLLPGGDEVEILIVDDGSQKDNTGEIADRYEREYPGICRAIHQENGGHGAAVNAGLREATGIFFKVVDSDDWVNKQAYVQVLNTLRRFVYGKDTLDMLITNFVYEKQGAKHKKVMNYNTALPKNEVFTWDDVKVFIAGQYILMHSVIYRTELLRDCGLELPMHTFYVDNIFVYEPLPHVRKMYYLDVNFYRYFIGRSDQSVNEQVMIGRIDQQIRVTKLMMGSGVLIKNTMGAAAVLLLFVLSILPLARILVLYLLYRGVAAVLQPVADNRLTACLSGAAQAQAMLLRVAASGFLLFAVTIALICQGTNAAYLSS